jgi:ParB family protein of integrating conjugative element (PFGI_1 class)
MTAPKLPATVGIPSTGLAATVEAIHHKTPPARRTPNMALVSSTGEDDLRSQLQKGAATAREAIGARNPSPSDVDLSQQDIDGVTIKLKVTDVLPCEVQPRIYLNEGYEDVRASIEAQNMTVVLEVTRKHTGAPYMLSAGGNTRLQILKDLWEETKNEKWLYQFFIFRKYVSDRRLLAKHLAENLARSDMRFWEVAKGVCELIQALEEEAGEPLSERRLEELLPKEGILAKRALIGRWRFTYSRLSSLGPALPQLTGQHVLDKFQPRLNALARLASKFDIPPEVYWLDLVAPTLARKGDQFHQQAAYDPEDICTACEVTLAERVGESISSIKRMLHTMSVANGNVTLADLRTPALPPSRDLDEYLASSREAGAGVSAASERAPADARNVDVGMDSGVGEQSGRHAPRVATRPRLHDASASSGASQGSCQGSEESHGAYVGAAGPVIAMPSPTLTIPSSASDVLEELKGELQILAEAAALTEYVIPCEAMPMGFFIEYPDPDALDAESAVPEAGELALWHRAQSSAVYWSLIKLSGQSDPACADRLPPDSRYYQSLLNDEFSMAYLAGTKVGDGPPDDVLTLAAKPHAKVMTMLLRVVVLMQAVSERYPDRWPNE